MRASLGASWLTMSSQILVCPMPDSRCATVLCILSQTWPPEDFSMATNCLTAPILNSDRAFAFDQKNPVCSLIAWKASAWSKRARAASARTSGASARNKDCWPVQPTHKYNNLGGDKGRETPLLQGRPTLWQEMQRNLVQVSSLAYTLLDLP